MHYIHMCYKCLACESKMASILNLIVGGSVGCPPNCPLFPYLKVVGYPLSCPLSCPLYPYMAVVGSLICMAKFPWAAHGQLTPLPTELPTFSYLEVVGCLLSFPLSCPLSCPLFPFMEVVGSLICMAKFPWAARSVAHVQPMGSEVGSSPVFPYGNYHKLGCNIDIPTSRDSNAKFTMYSVFSIIYILINLSKDKIR